MNISIPQINVMIMKIPQRKNILHFSGAILSESKLSRGIKPFGGANKKNLCYKTKTFL